MREIGAIEKALAALERFEVEIRHLKAELCAYLPEEPAVRQDYITHPITGKRIKIKRRK